MIDNSEDARELLGKFSDKFSPDKLASINIEDYTGTATNGKRDDFTYWVEIKLDALGGIKGGSSYKFGIYQCNKKPDERNGYSFVEESGNIYAWAIKYGRTKDEAFENIKNKINEIVGAASGGTVDYDEIEKIELGDAYKWKIAFLYSDNRLVPVYQKEALVTAAKRIGVYPNGEKITIAKLQEVLMKYFDDHKEEYDKDICKFGSYVWQIGTSDLSQSNQIIKYGAPGTGKTYTTKIETEEFFEIWKKDSGNTTAKFSDHYEFVQFHPSYSYEDFIEGIKPVLENGKTELKLKNGIFKAFCRKAAEYELWLIKTGVLKNKNLAEVTYADVKEIRDKKNPFVFPKGIEDDDFISQYIPPYFFIIDEINRADLSRVFGELMYCLEYRGYKGRIKTQYSELESGDIIFYEENGQHYFFIPNNVYIIGTMNTIDRSIESFDFALRRRFLWQRIDPNEAVLQDYFVENGKTDFGDYIIPKWKKLNNKISSNTLLGEDYQIGHSYLMKLDKYPNCTKTSYRDLIWTKHIQPILEEYFRGTGEAKKQIEELKKVFCK
ncbi:MAG: AAA family ATPase [Bacteroidales bacterium]|nr:AAA family ATPase [Bacteroidales bacterium]